MNYLILIFIYNAFEIILKLNKKTNNYYWKI